MARSPTAKPRWAAQLRHSAVAKIKSLGNIDPSATNSKRSGFVLRDTRHGPVAAAFPKKRGKATEGVQYFMQREFALAAEWASNPIAEELITAQFYAEGSPFVPRDFLISAMYGQAFEITMPDGTVLIPERDVNPSAQEILDQITNVVGSILYRAQIGWVGLAPSVNGYVLALQNGLPAWLPGAGFSGGGVNVQLFTSNDSWSIPPGAQRVRFILVGGGGGGGSGARRPSGTATSGGAAGGGAATTIYECDATQLNPVESIVIPSPGSPGASRVTDNQSGAPGGTGGTVTCTAGPITLRALGGAGGAGGNTIVSGGGGGSTGGTIAGSAGAGGSVGGAGNQPSAPTLQGCGGGGSGAGMSAAPATRNGGDGPQSSATTGGLWTGTLGGIGSSKTNPVAALTTKFNGLSSMGGGGGWVNADGTAGAGADGASFGGGGGGGGSSLNGNASGAGGTGGPGAVLIVAW